MRTVQLPFFLSSDKGARTAAGNRFSTRLSPPVDIPREASHTRVFVQEASVVYSMKNVTAENQTFRCQLGPSVGGATNHFDIAIPEGLYDSVGEIMDAIATAILAHSSSQVQASLSTEAFRTDYIDLVPDLATSRVQAVSRMAGYGLLSSPLMAMLGFTASAAVALGLIDEQHRHIQTGVNDQVIVAFRWNREQDALKTPYTYVYQLTLLPGVYTPAELLAHVNQIITAARNGTTSSIYYGLCVPSTYNADQQMGIALASLQAQAGYHVNNATVSSIADAKWPEYVSDVPGDGFLTMASLTAAIDTGLRITTSFTNTALTAPSVCWIDQVQIVGSKLGVNQVQTYADPFNTLRWLSNVAGTGATFGDTIYLDARVGTEALTTASDVYLEVTTDTVWVAELAGPRTVTASEPANVDRVNSLAIAAPGLASGVHVNGAAGACTLCRFPVTGARGSIIQFEPYNPIKSTYPLQGSSISQLNIELLDQNAEDVDTQGESFSCTVVVEYDLADD